MVLQHQNQTPNHHYPVILHLRKRTSSQYKDLADLERVGKGDDEGKSTHKVKKEKDEGESRHTVTIEMKEEDEDETHRDDEEREREKALMFQSG